MLVEPNQIDTDEHQQELMEEWGENSDGGHSYGYRVDLHTLEEGEVPPKEWLEKRVVQINEDLTRLHGSILRTEEQIKTYEDILNSLK